MRQKVSSTSGSLGGIDWCALGRSALLLHMLVLYRCMSTECCCRASLKCLFRADSAKLSCYKSAWAAPQIVKYLRDATHELRYTTMVALLQPAPETYELFDDVLLLSDGAEVLPGLHLLPRLDLPTIWSLRRRGIWGR